MDINEFCELYLKTPIDERISLLKEHITVKYLPYEKKMALCKHIIDCADYTPKIDLIKKRYYSPNTPLRFLFFSVGVFNAYTDIDYVYLEDGTPNVMGTFDLLDEINIFELLFNELGRESNTLKTIMKMMEEDVYNKENNLVGFMTTKIDSLETLLNAVMPIVEDNIIDFPKKEN